VGPFRPSVFSRTAVDGRIAAGGARKIGILDVAQQQWLTYFESPLGHHHFVKLSPDSKYLVAASDDELVVWHSENNWQTQKLVRSWKLGTECDPIFADDCKTIIVYPPELGVVVELDIASGNVVKRIPLAMSGVCALSPDDQLLAISVGKSILIWNRTTEKEVFQAHDLSQPVGFQFFDEGRILVSGHLSGDVRAWHLPTSQPLGQLFEPRERLGRPVSFQSSPARTGLIIWNRNPYDIKPVILGKVDLFNQ
jgi:hypothetical protein